jgi:hypothetical protein
MQRLPDELARLGRAKARLDRLSLYPELVSLDGVRVVVAPELFRLPGFRCYRGYAFWRTILVRDSTASDDLLTHELCHVWQAQQRPLAQLLAWARYPYRENPFEREARAAVKSTPFEHVVVAARGQAPDSGRLGASETVQHRSRQSAPSGS